MSALPALGASGQTRIAPAATGERAGQEGANGQDFASLLDDQAQTASASASKTAQKPRTRTAPPSEARAEHAESGPPDKPAAPARTEHDRGAAASGQAASDAGQTAAGTREQKATDLEHSQDDTWPPAGLAGIGMTVLPVLDAMTLGANLPMLEAVAPAANLPMPDPVVPAANLAMPNAVAAGANLPMPDPVVPAAKLPMPNAVAPGANLAINLANVLTQGGSGLPGDQGGPTSASSAPSSGSGAAGAAGTQAPAAMTGASAALAHGSFSAMLAQATTSSTPSAEGAEATVLGVALAALAGAADSKTDDAGTSPGADPVNLLAMGTTAPVSRTLASSAPFDGSPTPIPDLHGEQFDDALGARVSWLADQKIGHAHIRISPAELGPVEVRLHLNGDQVNASFLSAQPEVRQALESSLPRLREMLGQHGFQLGQADVGQQQQQARQDQRLAPGDNGKQGADELLQGAARIPTVLLHRRGLLDAYA